MHNLLTAKFLPKFSADVFSKQSSTWNLLTLVFKVHSCRAMPETKKQGSALPRPPIPYSSILSVIKLIFLIPPLKGMGFRSL